MPAEERWTTTQATNNFEELLEKVITTRKPIFIDGERNTAMLISVEEWSSIPDKLRRRVPADH